MTAHDDLPVIQVFPNGTETDAELEAQRDSKHQREIAHWEARQKCQCLPYACFCEWPLGEVCG